MKNIHTVIIAFCIILIGLEARADTIDFRNNYTLIGSFLTNGLYNLNGLDTWNGKPLSPTNYPNDQNRLLQSNVNFYANNNHFNELFIQVNNVITTEGAWWFGTAFYDVTETGIKFTLSNINTNQLPVFNSNLANNNEVLAYGPPTGSTSPLTDTPGYALSINNKTFMINTSSGTNDGFSSLGNISNASVINGGGVFELIFPSTIDVLTELDPKKMDVEAVYGINNQFISGSLLDPQLDSVPEPSLLLLFGVGFAGIAFYRERMKAKV